MLSLIGGLFGLVIGIGLSALIASAAGWESSVAGGTVVLAIEVQRAGRRGVRCLARENGIPPATDRGSEVRVNEEGSAT